MSSSKKTMKDFLFPMWGWNEDDERTEQWEDFKSTMETYWDQMREMQKTYMDAWKDQWNKNFPKLLEMQDSFAESLPEELPTLPGMPSWGLKPKDFMDKIKEFQEMANKHAMEQAESFFDFWMKAQEQTRDAVKDVVESVEEKVEEKAEEPAEAAEVKPVEEKPVEEKPAEEKPAEKKTPGRKPGTKKNTAKKNTAKKPAEKKPAEKKPAEEKPAEEKPVEEKPAE